MEKVKEKRLSEIFQRLDVDKDGVITENSIDITGKTPLM